MHDVKDMFNDEINSISVGNPALGLSDAVVGTYGPITRPGQCEMEGEGDGPVGNIVTGVGIEIPVPPHACSLGYCCCCNINNGGGSGYLIEETEIVL